MHTEKKIQHSKHTKILRGFNLKPAFQGRRADETVRLHVRIDHQNLRLILLAALRGMSPGLFQPKLPLGDFRYSTKQTGNHRLSKAGLTSCPAHFAFHASESRSGRKASLSDAPAAHTPTTTISAEATPSVFRSPITQASSTPNSG